MHLSKTEYERRYSPGIVAGRILISQEQYDRYCRPAISLGNVRGGIYDAREHFIPTRNGMWKFNAGQTPYLPVAGIFQNDLDEDDPMYEFFDVTQRFLDGFDETDVTTFFVEADEDWYFTYGCFCTAIAELNYDLSWWLLTKEFGDVYSVRHMSLLTED